MSLLLGVEPSTGGYKYYAWGANSYGQLGNNNLGSPYPSVDGGTGGNITTPTLIGSRWTQVSHGENFSIGLKNGALYTWGWNGSGQLGTGDSNHYSSPQLIDNGPWKFVTAGRYSSFAINDDDELWVCGYNNRGQLGIGSTTAQSVFIRSGTNYYLQVSSGLDHTLAVDLDGKLWACGYNNYGQLGTSNYTQYTSWQQVGTDTDWVYAACGQSTTHVLKTNGNLYSFGRGNRGQRGDGSTANVDPTPYPQRIGTATYSKVAMGNQHTIAIRTDGTMWGWGANNSYELGLGVTGDKTTPNQIGSSNWIDIAVGTAHSLAIKNDNTLYGWGVNDSYQLGQGDTATDQVPTQIGSDSWISLPTIYAQSSSSSALR